MRRVFGLVMYTVALILGVQAWSVRGWMDHDAWLLVAMIGSALAMFVKERR